MITLRKDAYSVTAITAAGCPPEIVRVLVVDESAPLECPRLSLDGRKRGKATREYIWGPDAAFLKPQIFKVK